MVASCGAGPQPVCLVFRGLLSSADSCPPWIPVLCGLLLSLSLVLPLESQSVLTKGFAEHISPAMKTSPLDHPSPLAHYREIVLYLVHSLVSQGPWPVGSLSCLHNRYPLCPKGIPEQPSRNLFQMYLSNSDSHQVGESRDEVLKVCGNLLCFFCFSGWLPYGPFLPSPVYPQLSPQSFCHSCSINCNCHSKPSPKSRHSSDPAPAPLLLAPIFLSFLPFPLSSPPLLSSPLLFFLN